MKLLFAAGIFAIGLLSFLSTAQAELVRVRLKADQTQVLINGQNLRYRGYEELFRSVSIPSQGNTLSVRVMTRGLKKVWAVKLNNEPREVLIAEKYLLLRGDNVRVGGQALPDQVLLSFSSSNKMDVVGVVNLEDYLVGVISSEMPVSWPLESLKAQAVAARSYAMAVIRERRDRAYHLESSVLDQVFKHVPEEDEKYKKAVQAVRETEGIELSTKDGEILKAFYHADCGGKTTTAKNVWNAGVNTGTAHDASCPANPKAAWALTLSKSELNQRVQKYFHAHGSQNTVSRIEILKPNKNERVLKVKLAFNDGVEKAVDGNEFRKMLGFQDLRSTMFDLETNESSFVFRGRGFGHGVGLCQWGSRALGLQGKNFRQILQHYYPLARLTADKPSAVAQN